MVVLSSILSASTSSQLLNLKEVYMYLHNRIQSVAMDLLRIEIER